MMNETDFSTVITVTGSKTNLVRMLNAGLRSLGADPVIDDTDDSESILRIVTGEGIVFHLQDLLNQGGAPLPREGVPMDEDDTEYFEDYGLIVSEIQEEDQELTVVFHFWSGDGNLGEWNFERDYDCFFRELLPLYDCEASIVKGGMETPQWATSFRLYEGDVDRLYIEPLAESAGYLNTLEKLAEINPEKYLPFLINSMKHQIECIQERLEYTLDRLNPPYEAPSTTVEDIPF
jgi:hypothetical protein